MANRKCAFLLLSKRAVGEAGPFSQGLDKPITMMTFDGRYCFEFGTGCGASWIGWKQQFYSMSGLLFAFEWKIIQLQFVFNKLNIPCR